MEELKKLLKDSTVMHVIVQQKIIEDALGEVKVKNKTSKGFISNQSEKLNQINNESNVTF